MYLPLSHPWAKNETLAEHLEHQGVSRRQFLKYCGQLAVLLGLGEAMAPRIARALEIQRRPSVIWLQLQECTGCVESTLRTSDPTIGDLLLDLISLDFNDTLMAAAGDAAERAMQTAMKENKGKYILIVTGSIPLGADGMYLTMGGRRGRDVLEEVAADAAAVVGVGACAHFGSVQSAKPNPTGAVGVADIIRDKPVVTIAGCPPIADVITATVVHYLTFKRLPELDGEGRPLFAYGNRIHDQCSRRAHFDAGQYVQTFDDEHARNGWCLYEMGCKGPETFSPCPILQWNGHTSWPIGSGHPCLGCTEPHFWDTMTPFYDKLPAIAGFGVERNANRIGLILAGAATAGVGAHAIATGIQRAHKGDTAHKPTSDQPAAKPQPEQSEEDPHD